MSQRGGGGGGKGGGGGGKGGGSGGKGSGSKSGSKGGGQSGSGSSDEDAPCTSNVQGNPCPGDLKCYFGECIESEGPGNMCGGPGSDENCKECMECNVFEDACKPIDDCVPSACEVDDDCERNDVCFQNDCALPDRIPGECTGTGDCDGKKFMECRDEDGCEWTDDSEQDLAALVASWQSVYAVDFDDSMMVLAVSALMVAAMYMTYICIRKRGKKGGDYQVLTGDDSC